LLKAIANGGGGGGPVTQGTAASAAGAWPFYLVQGTTANSSTNPIFIQATSGTAAIGQVGSFNISLSNQPTVITSAYTSGYAIGGLQTIALFRNTINPSATIANIGMQSAGGSTASLTLYAFTKSPASTCTNNAAFSLSSTDAIYIVPGFPIVLNPQPQGVGSTASFANQQGPFPVSNHDTTATVNIYLCAVTAGYTPASTTDLTFTIGAIRD
jgi:hypothetical protein